MPHGVQVTDGDTLVIHGERVRIVGIDTPETWKPRCIEERTLGLQAKRRLAHLLQSGDVRLVRYPHLEDRYNRTLARVFVNGQDVGDILVREGLAVRYDGHRPRRDWCAA